MNTKRHRCSRANIICCNYDNTRLIQDVGIRGVRMGTRFGTRRALKKRGEMCRFSQISQTSNYISPFFKRKIMIFLFFYFQRHNVVISLLQQPPNLQSLPHHIASSIISPTIQQNGLIHLCSCAHYGAPSRGTQLKF